MILTNFTQIQRYLGIHKNLDIAINYILEHDLNTLPQGKTEITDEVFVNSFEYYADGEANTFFEGHQNYLDMHIVLDGCEIMSVLDISKAKIRDDYENDCAFFDGEADVLCTLKKEDCLIVFPEDLHQPKIKFDNKIVKKIVFKVKIN